MLLASPTRAEALELEPDAAGKHRVAPLVEEMLSAIEGEMGRYERIITYWPVFGPDLEKCVTGALRESTISVSRQCGLVNTKVWNDKRA